MIVDAGIRELVPTGILNAAAEAGVVRVVDRALPASAGGGLYVRRWDGRAVIGIDLKHVGPEGVATVLAHEVGHAIDDAAGLRPEPGEPGRVAWERSADAHADRLLGLPPGMSTAWKHAHATKCPRAVTAAGGSDPSTKEHGS